MSIDTAKLEETIRRVLAKLPADQVADAGSATTGDGVFADMDSAITAAAKAYREYLGRSMADRRRYVEAIRECMLKPEHLDFMSTQAVLETGMGDVAHKYLKNKVAAQGTPGTEDLVTEAWSGDDGLTTVEYSPYGVIGAITPTTNPTETITCNTIGMLAAGNSVVFSPHPRAKNLSLWQVRKINQALRSVGAPDNLVVTVTEPSIDNTNKMISHRDVRMIVATGGPGIVKTVLSSGKKAIGAGAGNPPVVVDATADLDHAAKCIVDGASFDNNLPCTAEKECIAVDAITDLLKFKMTQHGAYEVSTEQAYQLIDLVIGERGPKTEWVGKPASQILEAIGVQPPVGVRLIIAEVGADCPLVVKELMMPILGIVRVPDVDTAIDLAVELEHGNRHTAIMHSKDVNKLTEMGKLIQTTVYVKNGPSYAGIGIGGEGYPTFTIAGPTGEGLTSARSFARRRRCTLVGALSVR
ncbi:MAG: aldehyde dehydrogenase family protein [Brooklawnia sp.]|jgi:propionaldehyde dehydrogenase